MLEILLKIEYLKILEIFWGTCLGAFVGAWGAFKFERSYRKNENQQKNFKRLVNAQGCLEIQKTIVNVIHENIIHLKDDPQRTGKLSPIVVPEIDNHISYSDLDFMLGKENLLLLNLITLQSNFRSAITALNERNDQHKVIQKTAHKYHDEESKHLYDINFKLLKDMTDDLYESVASLQQAFNKYSQELEEYGIRNFKGTKSSKISPIPNGPEKSS